MSLIDGSIGQSSSCSFHEPFTLIVSSPQSNGRVMIQSSYILLDLLSDICKEGVVCGVHTTAEDGLTPGEDTLLITEVVESVALIHAAAPYSEEMLSTEHSRVEIPVQKVQRGARVKDVKGDDVAALRVDAFAIDLDMEVIARCPTSCDVLSAYWLLIGNDCAEARAFGPLELVAKVQVKPIKLLLAESVWPPSFDFSFFDLKGCVQAVIEALSDGLGQGDIRSVIGSSNLYLECTILERLRCKDIECDVHDPVCALNSWEIVERPFLVNINRRAVDKGRIALASGSARISVRARDVLTLVAGGTIFEANQVRWSERTCWDICGSL